MKKFIVTFIVILSVLTLSGCFKKYQITYDLSGGTIEDGYPNSFTKPESVNLPIPKKDGSLFLGWCDKPDIIVEDLERKDYNLKARWVDIFDYDLINDNDIFNIEEEEYYVYIMRTGCSWCDKIKNDILRYIYKLRLPQYSESIKLYVVNLLKEGVRSKIFRNYDQDEDGFFVDGVEDYNDLYIPSTPTLIKISKDDGVKKSSLIANGASSIVRAIKKTTKTIDVSDNEVISYTINYDFNGGYSLNQYTEKFYNWSYVELPIVEKENCYFLGWYEFETKIDNNNIEKRNYNLQARFLELESSEIIPLSEMYKMNSPYYILFVKSSAKSTKDEQNALRNLDKESSKMEKNIRIYNAWAKSVNEPIIYLIDLLDDQRIYRTNKTTENGYLIDGITNELELYIKNKLVLIEIKNVNGINQSTYVTDTYDSVLKYLVNICPIMD